MSEYIISIELTVRIGMIVRSLSQSLMHIGFLLFPVIQAFLLASDSFFFRSWELSLVIENEIHIRFYHLHIFNKNKIWTILTKSDLIVILISSEEKLKSLMNQIWKRTDFLQILWLLSKNLSLRAKT